MQVPLAPANEVERLAALESYAILFGLEASETSRAVSFCGHVVETGRALVLRRAA
ncbi:MAG: hypothetical protein ABW061_24495 [Polyangiaceae bacterium]